ncbi:possible ABC transport system periplasmic substrate-binding protein [Lentisphaera araneosa HTCC2155]|uniref:Possible ABC transport system periplasmic substrate-binding protein n=1 Tax=Lentisphaera araneosa HTCC2155 TaxID=313628 RepID=A6DTV1_9BACT|nr:MlaD family protein [Lentisphaera araneosa]EDM24920.1 possible ABC transport system periplasmic substrate-binding protein [Lentisphaera araneosa HTCC2155]
MENKHFKLGIFVLTGLVLFVLALFYLGLREQFRKSYDFVTYFDRSVQGLEVGSSVKLKGVTVGRVSSVELWEQEYVKVTMSAVPRNVSDSEMKEMSEAQAQLRFEGYIVEAVDKGLRVSLNYAGITGMKYIELDYVDMKRDNSVELPFTVTETYIPALRSSLEDIVLDVEKIMDGVARIDFQQIGENAEKAMSSAEKTMASLDKFATSELLTLSKDLSSSLKRIDKFTEVLEKEIIAAKVGDTTTSVRKTLAKLDVNSAELNKALASVTKTSDMIGKDFSKISDGVTVALATVEKNLKALASLTPQLEKMLAGEGKIGKAVVGLAKDTSASLDSFDRTLDSIRRLTDYLERNPNALIQGKN